jgi:hypothetical protein
VTKVVGKEVEAEVRGKRRRLEGLKKLQAGLEVWLKQLECLLSKCETLNSNPSPTRKK